MKKLREQALSASQGVTQHMVEIDGPTLLALLDVIEAADSLADWAEKVEARFDELETYDDKRSKLRELVGGE